jgi:predicted outer membrane repeat protein
MNYGQLYFILISFIALAMPSHAKTIFVDDNASAGGDGASWASAHKYLQDALAVAEYGDEIWVAEGTYKPDQGAGKNAGDRASPFVLVNGVGMYGGFWGTESSRDPQGDNNQTILSGEIDENSSLWSLNVVSGANLNANTTLDGFRITKGNANGAGGTVYANGGGLWIKDSEFKISNCVFTNNSANDDGGGIYSYSSLTLTNCILWKNTSDSVEGHGLEGESFKSVVLQETVEAEYPGDPNAKDAVYEPNLNILQGWDGDARAFDANPLFVNIDNPIGPDGIWFTDDDGLRITEDSPAKDAGYNASLPADVGDVDNDGNFDEIISLDPIGYRRVQNETVDIGAYEFGDSMIETHQVTTSVSQEGYGVVTGGSDAVEVGESVEINADPNQGYIFSNWSGDASGSLNPLTITVDSAKNITANFAQDLNDTDGDGLSNYAELVTYGTKVDDNDTDNDGLLDNEEIQIGTDPKSSDSAVFNFGKSSVTNDPESYSLVTRSAYDQALLDANETAEQAIADAKVWAKAEGVAEGKASVTSDPASYSLVSSSAYDQALLDANQTAEQAIADAKVSAKAEGITIGKLEGEQSVLGNPGSFRLVTKESYDLLQSKLEECESAKFPWVEFDDFSDSTLDSEKWELMWWHGAQPPTTSNGMLVLNGNGQLHSPPSRNSPLVQAFIDRELPPGELPTNHSIAEVKAEGIYGLQAKLMVPNGSAKETGVGMGAVKFYEDGTRHQFEFEIGYWDENNDILSLEFDYRTPGLDQEKIAYYRQGEFDKFYEVSLIHLNGTNFLYFGEELIFEFNATWTPNFFHFFAFNDQDPDWKPFTTYVKDVKVLVPGTPNPVPTTPYTPAWFYVPSQGWMWTQKSAYPYFYDANSSNWMYFQSGHENPRFYHYGTKEWMTVE